MVIVYHIMGALSIGKITKDLIRNLCNLPIDKNAGRVGRARAARKTEKTLGRAESLIRKEVNISEMLVRMVGVEPYLITIKSRVHSRFATFAYFVFPYLTYLLYHTLRGLSRGFEKFFSKPLNFFYSVSMSSDWLSWAICLSTE